MEQIEIKDQTQFPQQLIVDAKLLDVGLPSPKPGIVYSISLMQYQVLELVQGDYPHALIYVGHDNPILESEKFLAGSCHRLYLIKEFPELAGILDKFQTEVSKIFPFFCVSFELVR